MTFQGQNGIITTQKKIYILVSKLCASVLDLEKRFNIGFLYDNRILSSDWSVILRC